MGYESYLKQMLSPLGVYALDMGIGAKELKVIGAQMDEIFDALETIKRESTLITAESYGLTGFEEIMLYRPAYLTPEDERRAVIALLKIRGGCFTKRMLQETLSGCGLAATIEESGEKMTVTVSFPNNRGVPDGFEKLQTRIEQIVPCHLLTKYVFIYTTWQELMAALPNWQTVKLLVSDWHQMETYQ